MRIKTVFKNVDEIMDLYTTYGSDVHTDEPVSHIEHMCQCAQLAQLNCYDNEVILAAFMHDIGYLLQPATAKDTNVDYKKIASAYLSKKGFSERVVNLVASHVQAKRYFSYVDDEYYGQLSPAGKETLKSQGGIMSAEEAKKFENDKYFRLYTLLQRWDDNSTHEQMCLPDLNIYKKKMIEHLMEHNF